MDNNDYIIVDDDVMRNDGVRMAYNLFVYRHRVLRMVKSDEVGNFSYYVEDK